MSGRKLPVLALLGLLGLVALVGQLTGRASGQDEGGGCGGSDYLADAGEVTRDPGDRLDGSFREPPADPKRPVGSRQVDPPTDLPQGEVFDVVMEGDTVRVVDVHGNETTFDVELEVTAARLAATVDQRDDAKAGLQFEYDVAANKVDVRAPDGSLSVVIGPGSTVTVDGTACPADQEVRCVSDAARPLVEGFGADDIAALTAVVRDPLEGLAGAAVISNILMDLGARLLPAPTPPPPLGVPPEDMTDQQIEKRRLLEAEDQP